MKQNKSNELEFSTNEILQNMCYNTYNNFNTYELNVIDKNYLKLRNKIFNIIQKITMKFGFKSQTFFLSTYYLDLIFIKKKKTNINIHKLGLACLCLSSKFCENDPIVPQLQYFVKMFNNITGYKNFISMTELMYTEVIVCKILKYKLNYFTAYDFIAFFFCHGILKLEQIKEIEKEFNINNRKKSINDEEFELDSFFVKNFLGKIYRTVRNYLDIVVKIDKICMKYSPIYIAIYLVEKSMDECLENEYKKIKQNLEKEEMDKNMKKFCERNNKYYKEIMNEFYKIHFEDKEQYLQLIMDDEINCIFHKENKNKNKPNYSTDTENNKDKIFNTTMTNGFYKRLKLSSNNDKENERNNDINNKNNNYIEKNIEKEEDIENDNKINNLETEDDLNTNLNINELRQTMNSKNSHISAIKKIPKISMKKINTFDKIEINKINKTLELKTEKNSYTKFFKTKVNNMRKTHMPKMNTFSIKNSSSFKTIENIRDKPYSKKIINGNNRNIIKKFNESIKYSTSTNFYKNKNKTLSQTENNSKVDLNKTACYLKVNSIKGKPNIINTATTKKHKKIIPNKNEMSLKSVRSKKLFKDKFDTKTFTSTSDNFYSSNYNKISVNKLKDKKESEMKNLNINKELKTKKISYTFNQNNSSKNNTLKDIGTNYINEDRNKCKTTRNNERIEDINDKSTKYKKITYNKIHSNYIQSKNNKKNEIKKIIFTKKPNDNSIKEGYSFKTLNSINNDHATKKQFKTINKDTTISNSSSVQPTFSSFYNIIQRTKKLFNKDKSDVNNINKNGDINNINTSYKKEEQTKNFFKSKQNFYNKENKTKEINKEKEKESNNANTIIINNNININFGNKKEIKIPEINFNNTIVTSDKNTINIGNKFNTQRIKDENKLGNNSTIKKPNMIKSIFEKFNFNKKIINKSKK